MNNNIQQIGSELDSLGLAPLSMAERERLLVDPRPANFLILKRQIQALGFEDVLAETLWQQMKEESSKIIIPCRQLVGQDVVGSELSFSRSKNGNYFMDHYTVQISGFDLETGLRNKKQTIPVEYYQTADRTLTLLESYNLLKGRFVYKQICNPVGEYYKDWLKYDGNYTMISLGIGKAYDIRGLISDLPMGDTHKSTKDLLAALGKGNKEMVSVLDSSGTSTLFKVQANPPGNKLDIYLGNRKVQISKTGEVSYFGLKFAPAEKAQGTTGVKNENPATKEKRRRRLLR